MTRWIMLFFIWSIGQLACAQWVPDSTYWDPNQHVEYLVGDYPLVLSIPHGGYLEPVAIPDRNCSGCSYIRDAYTQELGRAVHQVFVDSGWCRPHVIINLLHRKKLDANRDIIDGADGDPIGELAWVAYHNFVDTARMLVLRNYGQGLFLDLHGHGHPFQRAELGYRLTGSELRQSDVLLNVEPTSITHLVQQGNGHAPTVSTLVRDSLSFGDLLTQYTQEPAVPSSAIPFPQVGEPFFSGGYNTLRYGSQQGGTFDAIQLECHQNVRFNATNRAAYAVGIAQALREYMNLHYAMNWRNCRITGVVLSLSVPIAPTVKAYPNPASDQLYLYLPKVPTQIQLVNTLGQVVCQQTAQQSSVELSLQGVPNGHYIVWLRHPDGRQTSQSIVKTRP